MYDKKKAGVYARTSQHHQRLSRGRRRRPRAQGHRPQIPRHRIRVRAGTVGLRQDHAPQHHRRSRPLYVGRSVDRRRVDQGLQGRRLGRIPQPQDRFCLPKLQPHFAHDHFGQRRDGFDAVRRQPSRAQQACARSSRKGRAFRTDQEAAQSAFGRSDAARFYRACADQRPRDHSCRRADRRARQRDQHPGHGPSQRDLQDAAHHHGHAQLRACGQIFDAHRQAQRRRGHRRQRSVHSRREHQGAEQGDCFRRARQAADGQGEKEEAQAHEHELLDRDQAVLPQPYDKKRKDDHDRDRRQYRHHRRVAGAGDLQRLHELCHRPSDDGAVRLSDTDREQCDRHQRRDVRHSRNDRRRRRQTIPGRRLCLRLRFVRNARGHHHR